MSRRYVLLLPLLLAGCAKQAEPEAPLPPQIGMANPAAVYCQQKGGESIRQVNAQGESSLCKLPNGETIEEWALWRRDHPQKK
ncbi:MULTISPECIES: DUF333 domain-containing protein [Kluyvera]|nr:DUF333 domain-containing protein [Kluyvera ascorbata]BBV66461.1 lipoprotein [Klebsiella sp. STW0522-44]KFC92234.1 putative hemolysin [Kluyvera ascorbata ATCC 33433]MDT8702659.1 DUF333 domain-containing protein [Kluyvera ascorbata]MDU1196602.1 DUF333 domain-containing protein [Kluyvera ascorbata]MDU3913763.1 DUF333 domain-containing protein [Kluyvera ascorbata]